MSNLFREWGFIGTVWTLYSHEPSLGFPAVYWFSRHLLTTFYNTHLVLITQKILENVSIFHYPLHPHFHFSIVHFSIHFLQIHLVLITQKILENFPLSICHFIHLSPYKYVSTFIYMIDYARFWMNEKRTFAFGVGKLFKCPDHSRSGGEVGLLCLLIFRSSKPRRFNTTPKSYVLEIKTVVNLLTKCT